MKYNRQDHVHNSGVMGHDFITSGAGVSADQRYGSLFAWGGSAAITYDQVFPGGSTASGTATITQSDIGIHGTIENVAVTDGGTIIGYRK